MENLKMVRGDTLAFGFEVDGVKGVDGVYFSVKKTKYDDEYILQKTLSDGVEVVESGKYSVRVAPSDTYNLEVGTYYYDLQIEANGDVFTVLYGTLEIEADITRETEAEKVIKSGCYYLNATALFGGEATVFVISFAQESNNVFLVGFADFAVIDAGIGTYTKTKEKVTVTYNEHTEEFTINGSQLYYGETALIYKPNFDVDFLESFFEEV